MKVAVAVFILMVCLHAGEALKCKACPSILPCRIEDTEDSDCTGSCMKVTVDGQDLAVRSCSPIKMKERCESATTLGKSAYSCACNTDLCNSGPSISPPSVFGLTILLAAARGLLN